LNKFNYEVNKDMINGAKAQWSNGATAQQCNGAKAQRNNGTTA